jgi:hypothetical protein
MLLAAEEAITGLIEEDAKPEAPGAPIIIGGRSLAGQHRQASGRSAGVFDDWPVVACWCRFPPWTESGKVEGEEKA